ncbi:MAG TPA: acyltransferase family protein [Chitinophagaceae bacterium]|nr:acyltransferase family protein [Chitinophagaceae bacterium]
MATPSEPVIPSGKRIGSKDGPPAGSTRDGAQRLHGIDALRGVAMLLGILLHSVIAYKEDPLPNWPTDPGFRHWGFDYLYTLIHSFRMPMFFLIAGYFSRMLFHKSGEAAFVRHRFKRIFIPFAASLLLVLPLTIFPFLVYRYSLQFPGQWERILETAARGLLRWNGMAHLWFLYYLLFYYGAAVAWFRLASWAPVRPIFGALAKAGHRLQTGSFTALALLSLPVWALLATGDSLYLHVETGILPAPAYLLFYALFFGLGWLVNRQPEALSWMRRHGSTLLVAGIGLSVPLFLAEREAAQLGTALLLVKGGAAIQILCAVYGCIGLFLRTFQSESRLWRYFSDATYWMYLVHMMLVAGLQVAFLGSPVPGALRFPIVLGATLILTLATYHWFVRYTFIGTTLHGKRTR